MNTLIPLTLSFVIGYVLLRRLTNQIWAPTDPRLLLTGAGIGLGISASLAFFCLVIFNQIVPGALIASHLMISIALFLIPGSKTRQPTNKDLPLVAIVLALTIPTILSSYLYPQGGWDAWAIWNMKARFLFSGSENWQSIFDPAMTRSHVAYPLLLPLMNTWLWCLSDAPNHTGPQILTIVITLLTSGILFFAIKDLTRTLVATLITAWVFTLPLFIMLAGSQYADLPLGLFLLITLTLFKTFDRSQNLHILTIAGLALGFMSFVKVDGLLLSVITASTFVIWQRRNLSALRSFALGFLPGALPTILFLFLYSKPGNDFFIFGPTSLSHPSTLERLAATLMLCGREFIDIKWHGLWIILLVAIALRHRTALRGLPGLISAIITIYLAVIISFYWINTHDPITWWINTSFHRLLFALIPALIFWVALLWSNKKGAPSPLAPIAPKGLRSTLPRILGKVKKDGP